MYESVTAETCSILSRVVLSILFTGNSLGELVLRLGTKSPQRPNFSFIVK